jgi:hypothetical protein
MNIQKFNYFFIRVRELGVKNTYKRIHNRTQRKLFAIKWNSFKNTKMNVPYSFESLFPKLLQHDFVQEILNHPLFQETLPEYFNNKNFILEKADEACEGTFYVLGKVVDEAFAPRYDSSLRSKSLGMKNRVNNKTTAKKDDVKIPWELSRMQHIYFLGKAYEESSKKPFDKLRANGGKTPQKKYAEAFCSHINNWIENNPFPHGVNWVNPMEVAIRAINLIWSFHFFKNSKNITKTFWKKLTRSLYFHAIYLENNWEESDKPNNHYISDLVGHLYLCIFFKNVPRFENKKEQTLKKLFYEFDRQILPDGTSYEGSTAYHKLDTELFLHVYTLCDTQICSLPNNFLEKLLRMFNFLDACSVGNDRSKKPFDKLRANGTKENELVHIGDDDSGKIVCGISPPLESLDTIFSENHSRRADNNTLYQSNLRKGCDKANCYVKHIKQSRSSFLSFNNKPPLVSSDLQSKLYREVRAKQKLTNHYPHFGLTIIKDNSWHITFRHPTFNKKQPTGHFHQDKLSVTLAIDNIPILIDPGSYTYTPQPEWRNKFRSSLNHNNVTYNSAPFSSLQNIDLFQLPRAEQNDTSEIEETERYVLIENSFSSIKRKLVFHPTEQKVLIEDKLFGNAPAYWNLVFHPDIRLIKKDLHSWNIYHNGKCSASRCIASLRTTLIFEKETTFYSPEYGTKVPCSKLTAYAQSYSKSSPKRLLFKKN